MRPKNYYGKHRMNNPDLLGDAMRNSITARGIVEWSAENPPENEVKFENGLYRIGGVVENVATDGLFDALVAFMVAGGADATKAVTVMQLGDDVTTPARVNTGCGNPINGDGNLLDVTNVIGVPSDITSGSFLGSFAMSNTWQNDVTTDSAAEVAVKTYGTTGTNGVCCGHAVFINPAIPITAPGGTLTINYKFIFAPA